MEPSPSIQCEVCHIGNRRAQRTTYTYWVDGQLILVPNITAWVCDVCADVEYEVEAIARLELLLGIETDFPDDEGARSAASNIENLASLNMNRQRSV